MTTKLLLNIDLDTSAPFTKDERRLLTVSIMELLLEDGKLGELGMLLNRYENTIRHYELGTEQNNLCPMCGGAGEMEMPWAGLHGQKKPDLPKIPCLLCKNKLKS